MLKMPVLFEKVIFFHSKNYIFIEKLFLSSNGIKQFDWINIKCFNGPTLGAPGERMQSSTGADFLQLRYENFT